MKMTITEKILARSAGKESVKPGDNVWVRADILLTHDICGPGTIGIFQREFGRNAKVWDREKVVILPDHYIFTEDEKAKRNVEILRRFAKEQRLPYYYDVGTENYRGVCHVALPEAGHVRPGEVIFGTDSHTCTHGALGAFATGVGNTDAAFVMGAGKLLLKVPPTMRFELNGVKPNYIMGKDIILRIIGELGVEGAAYCAMEFCGDAVPQLSIDERMTICNMAVEAGAKNGIFAPDDVAIKYAQARTRKPFTPVRGDDGALFQSEKKYDLAALEPGVAKPYLPDNYVPARELKDVKIDRVYIGSCTGGKFSDFLAAAVILQGKRVGVDTFLVPATSEVAGKIRREKIKGDTLEDIFKNAGCLKIAPPSCAACLGGPEDTFGRTRGREVVVSATNRNFIGRMGSKDAPIYLASPLTAAASAVAGRIVDPREIM